ncbi:hypothetical protein [Vibrio cholerae]|uniref:hypothetical protein n=1 Tax=Vibrio cholerae TaxID=666 RepID=UPI000E0BE949|nr:hypothetical protein [Vibrio cholerae]
MMTKEEVSDYENGIFKPSYEMFERIVESVNDAMSELDREIKFSVINSYDFNAHARKPDENTYTIQLRSGIIPMTLQIIGENVDFYTSKYPMLEDKETPVALGCVFVWTQIFAHELGHIIRGHVDLTKNNSTNLIDDEQLSMIEVPSDTDLEKDQIKMLMEFDADLFSTFFVAEVLLNVIKNPNKDIEVEDETILSVAIASIMIFFNFLCETEGKITKYPPAMVRANVIQEKLVGHLSGKTTLSDSELSRVMTTTIYDVFSFLDDEGAFQQDMGQQSLDFLAKVENRLLHLHPVFVDLISAGIIMKFGEVE